MLLNKIRMNNKKPELLDLKKIIGNLAYELNLAGYETDFDIKNSQSIKIGMHMCCFKLDLNKHDYNIRKNPHTKDKKTRFPTWNQRVQFNDIVNDVLDALNVSCKIKSGDFLIRDGILRLDEIDWLNQKPEYMINNERNGFKII